MFGLVVVFFLAAVIISGVFFLIWCAYDTGYDKGWSDCSEGSPAQESDPL